MACNFIFLDIRGINSIAVQAVNSGMIIVGGGVVKHHTANANLMVSLSTARKMETLKIEQK